MSNAGRKSKWGTHVEPRLAEIACWCRDGMIEADMCKKLGVSHEAFNDYKNKYPELVDVLKDNKEIIDQKVENALLKRALGFEYTETTREPYFDTEKGTMELKISKTVDKMVVPDTTAQIFWLKNRKRKEWRDKQEVGLTDNEGQDIFTGKIDLTKVNIDDLKTLAGIV